MERVCFEFCRFPEQHPPVRHSRRRIGFPRWTDLVCLGAFVVIAGSSEAQLSTALEVRSLTFDEAEAGQPVDLVGIVIFADPPGTIFVQDETAGTFFQLEGRTPPKPGDAVRVRGTTYPGLYLPGIKEARFEALGHRGLPEARPATFEDLTSGRFHYQRVAVEGIVRSIVPEEEDASVVRVALGAQIVEVRVQEAPSDQSLIDHRVRAIGLAAGHINNRRQLVGPYLRCSGWSEIESLTIAPDEAEAPTVSTTQLLTFDIEGQGGHRIRVSGVTLAMLPDGEIFIRDEESSVGVRLRDVESELRIGDRIEVVGFPEMAKFSASVVDASLLRREPGPPPPPVRLAMEDLLNGESDGELVSIEATITDSYRTPDGHVLLLQQGENTLQARAPLLPELFAPGSRLQVTGICRVESTLDSQYSARPASVSLNLRSAGDIRLLSAPHWWTPRRLALGSIVLLTTVLLGGLWIASLRRQVSRQTDALRGRIENEAAFEERQRIAREFHDTLEQELAGLSLRLDAAAARATDKKLDGFIQGARSLVTRIQTETRNLVSDLREEPGQTGSIGTALQELAADHPEDVKPRVRCETGPDLPDLPAHVVHHLKRIAQEAITNAIKHSDAETVTLRADCDGSQFVMRIEDDGSGFDAPAETRGKSGHFGCMGIRERCRKIGAEVTWESKPGQGSRLCVHLPLSL